MLQDAQLLLACGASSVIMGSVQLVVLSSCLEGFA